MIKEGGSTPPKSIPTPRNHRGVCVVSQHVSVFSLCFCLVQCEQCNGFLFFGELIQLSAGHGGLLEPYGCPRCDVILQGGSQVLIVQILDVLNVDGWIGGEVKAIGFQ